MPSIGFFFIKEAGCHSSAEDTRDESLDVHVAKPNRVKMSVAAYRQEVRTT